MMLQLHDLMKADTAYQADAPQTAFDFPAGSSWIAFTDQVSHAAMAGQYQLEQTFLLPVEAMRSTRDDRRSACSNACWDGPSFNHLVIWSSSHRWFIEESSNRTTMTR